MEYLERYIGLNLDFRDRWAAFRSSSHPRLSSVPRPVELTPILPLKTDETQLNNLYWAFVRLNAEAQVVLEQLFLFGLRKWLRKDNPIETRLAAKKLMAEESLHCRAYRDFLRDEPLAEWPDKSLILKGLWPVKRALCVLLNIEPLAMILPAAKFETYSLFYSRFLSRCHSRNSNRWSELNYLHMLDETHHVNFDYEFYHQQVSCKGVAGRGMTALMATLVFIGLQLLLICACGRISRQVFPKLGPFSRWRVAFAVAHWGVRIFPPYIETRRKLRERFSTGNFIHSRLLSFISW